MAYLIIIRQGNPSGKPEHSDRFFSQPGLYHTVLFHGNRHKTIFLVETLLRSGPVYTGPNKFLHGQKCTQFHVAFTRDRQNWTNFLTAKCASFGPAFFRSQTCTLNRSKIPPVPPVPCKHNMEPCQFLSVQKLVRTRVNRASVCTARTSGQYE